MIRERSSVQGGVPMGERGAQEMFIIAVLGAIPESFPISHPNHILKLFHITPNAWHTFQWKVITRKSSIGGHEICTGLEGGGAGKMN